MIPLLLALALTGSGVTDADLAARTRAFLDAYAADKVEQVMAMVDPDSIAVYGSDASEFCGTRTCLRQMMADDLRLWRTARFGAMAEVTIRKEGRLATIFFQAPFSAGGAPEVPVRISLVWRYRGDRWLLTQASNVVPTTNSSARQILSKPAARSPKSQDAPTR